MTNEEILKKAIEKAQKNGYRDGEREPTDFQVFSILSFNNYYGVIFSHDFAKAFWGEENTLDEGSGASIPIWQYHLQRMVLEEEPLKYLEKFL